MYSRSLSGHQTTPFGYLLRILSRFARAGRAGGSLKPLCCLVTAEEEFTAEWRKTANVAIYHIFIFLAYRGEM